MDEKIQEFTGEEMALPNWSCAGHLQTEMTKQLCVCVCVCRVHPITRGHIMRGLLIPGMKGMHVNTSYVHNFPAVVL